VTLRGLEFGPSQRKVDAVRIYGRRGITVEECSFSHVGGIAIVANHFSAAELTIRRNTILDSGATAMYLGCHDGRECEISDLLIEGNYIHGVSAPDPEIGYGIQVKLNSTAIVRDNVVINTKGPGIMVYGAADKAKASVIERNFTMGSRHSSGILLGGGPAIVRNNIAVENFEAGIRLQDYGERGLLNGILVTHNTVYDNRKGGIMTDPKLSDVTLAYNAVHTREGTHAFPSDQPGLRQVGNLDCTLLSCFVDPATRNFSPVLDSPLLRNGIKDGRPGTGDGSDRTAQDDFFGRPRKDPAAIGAVEFPGEPVVIGRRQG
jgi:hypothetical protein